VCKALRLVCHTTLGLIVVKKKKKTDGKTRAGEASAAVADARVADENAI